MKHIDIILKEMCKRVGVSPKKVNFKQEDWFSKHSWTDEQYDDFKEWLTEYMNNSKEARQELMSIPSKNRYFIERFVSYFLLDYSWKIAPVMQGSCSELIIRLTGMVEDEILKRLKEINVYKVMVEGFWDFYKEKDKQRTELLVDLDNPSSPDFEWHATIRLNTDFDGAKQPAIVASQHCQHQIFYTLEKIASKFGLEIEAYDGGGMQNYEDWNGEKLKLETKEANAKRDATIKEIKKANNV